MKTIKRSAEPGCLARQPGTQNWRAFMATQCHHDLHHSLQQEQEGLCGYCELEVHNGEGHIEHMEPRSRNGARTYDYTNLVLSCNGGHAEHCGHYKDNRSGLSWDAGRFLPPHDPATTELFQYLVDGSMQPTDKGADRASYLIRYLGLNCARLSNRRRDHARILVDTLGDQPDAGLVAWLRQEHLQPNGNGQLSQFYSVSKQILEP